jgi:Arylsulfotransferase (ASST)
MGILPSPVDTKMQNYLSRWLLAGFALNVGCNAGPHEELLTPRRGSDAAAAVMLEAGTPLSAASTTATSTFEDYAATVASADTYVTPASANGERSTRADDGADASVAIFRSTGANGANDETTAFTASADHATTTAAREGTDASAPNGLTTLDAGVKQANVRDSGLDAALHASAEPSSASHSALSTPPIFDAGLDASSAFEDAGTPTLTSLQFEGAHTALYPPFDSLRSRYSIIAASDNAVLSVTATTTGGAQLTVNGIDLLDGEQTELVEVAPGSEMVFTLGNGPNSTQYVVQYLPPNFPTLLVETPSLGASDDPVYISLASTDAQYIAKLDQAGVPLYYKGSSDKIYDFKKHPDGTLSYSVRRSNAAAGAYQVLLNPAFEEIASLSAVGLVNTDVHDFLILPNGNRVFISYEPASRDLSAFGLSATQDVVDGVFQEVTPDRQVAFQWNTWEHVQYDHSVYAFENRDYAHLNSIAVDHDGHWLLSSRGLSQVFKIDRYTGEVLWRLGGIASDFSFVNDPYNGICGQHTASRLDNGHILIFDNARDCLPEIFGSRPNRSRAVEYALDEVDMTAEVVWSYERNGVVAASQGSAQRLSNGNTMIGWGSGPSLLATEVTPAGEVVYELTGRARNNSRVSSYRARKFED